jgi:hypothetical protein
VTPSHSIVYRGPLDNAAEVIQFFRREALNLRSLNKLIITTGKTVILDVNRDSIEFPGLTYGNPALERLLEELGVVFTPATLHNPEATPNGVKEYRLSARWTWGHDRVM